MNRATYLDPGDPRRATGVTDRAFPVAKRGLQRVVRRLRIICLLTALACVAGQSAQAIGSPPDLEDLVGERLEFRLRWGVIPAASAVLEVEQPGDGELLFRASARTLPVLRLIYPVDEKVESTVRMPGMRAFHYLKGGKEGRGPKHHEEIVFDLEQGVARRSEDGEQREPIEVPPGVQDPFGSFYAFRTMEIPESGVLELDISDGKKVVRGKIEVIGEERVKTPAGEFDTFIIAPGLEGLGGIFKKSPGATLYIWLTNDAWRRPVKLQSKVAVGHFTAELVAWEHLAEEDSSGQDPPAQSP